MTTDNTPLGLSRIPKQRYIELSSPGFPSLQSPGIAIIRGAGRPLKFDEQEGYGLDGGSLTIIGSKFVHFEVEIRIWEAAHWVQWQLFEMMLDPPATPAGAPKVTLGINHPILKNVGIEKVYVEDPGQWEPVGDTGLWNRVIKFIKWVKPRQVLAPSLEGPPAVGAGGQPKPQTATQKAIAEQDAKNGPLRTAAQ